MLTAALAVLCALLVLVLLVQRPAIWPVLVVLAVLWLWTLAALHWAGGLCAGAPRSAGFRAAGFRAALGLGAAAAGVLLWVSPLIPASGVTSSYISTQNAFVANLFLQSRDLPLKKPKNYEAQLQQLGNILRMQVQK